LQFFLRFFDPRDVLKRYSFLLVVKQLGAGLSERKCFIASRLHLPQHENPDTDNKKQRRPGNQHGPIAAAP